MDNLKNGNGVVTVCYGQTQEWNSREKAARFFIEAMMNSEGSERERYSNVYFGIIQGFPICTDSE